MLLGWDIIIILTLMCKTFSNKQMEIYKKDSLFIKNIKIIL